MVIWYLSQWLEDVEGMTFGGDDDDDGDDGFCGAASFAPLC